MNHNELVSIRDAIMNTATVKKLLLRNKKLEAENKALKNLLYSIPEFRCKCAAKKGPKPQRLRQKKVESCEDEVEIISEIKKEKCVPEVIVIEDDGAVVENIRMEISEPADSAVEEVDEEEVEEVEEEDEGKELQKGLERLEEGITEEEEVEEVEVEEVEEVEEEEEEEEVEEVEEVEEEEEEEAEVFEITIGGKSYYTNDENNGTIYAVDNDEVGDEVGKFVNGKPKFNKT